MTVLPSPEAMIVICTVILIAYTAHVVDKSFASSEQFEFMLKARERIMGLQAENAALRTQLADVTESMGRVEERCAKLRELLWELYEDQCDECDRWKYRDRMRELGIEADS